MPQPADRAPKRIPHLAIDKVLATDPSAWISGAREIGWSRKGHPILGFETGAGLKLVTLIGGCHADEPVGPALLDRLASHLTGLPDEHAFKRDLTWRIVPHVNPDGEERNRGWTQRLIAIPDHRGKPDRGYDLWAYLRSVVRELPGDDIEFGFPIGGNSQAQAVRPENRAVAEFLSPEPGRPSNPIHVHGSFHGMGLAPGPWFLIERSWIGRTATLRRHVVTEVETMGYRLFDAERHGEKGFHRIAPGFSTRPDSGAMREFFEARSEPEEAAKFLPSSMEFARSHGNDPLTLVTEMPLFLTPSLPTGLVERRELEEVRARLLEAVPQGRSNLEAVARKLEVTPMPIRDQMRLQLSFLSEAIQAAISPTDADRARRARPEPGN